MITDNPCSQCLVTPMCFEVCDNLIKYLESKLLPRYKHYNFVVLARQYKRGIISLTNNDENLCHKKYNSLQKGGKWND